MHRDQTEEDRVSASNGAELRVGRVRSVETEERAKLRSVEELPLQNSLRTRGGPIGRGPDELSGSESGHPLKAV